MANVEFGTGKTVLILTIVAACFAVLWPKIFYPMLLASSNTKTQADNLNGCCDVIFETDVNAIKIMTEMCGTILSRHEDLDPKLAQAFQQGKLSKEIVATCRAEVLNICGIDIAEFLSEKVRIGQTYRQILDEIRSFNISVCLRRHFGVNPGSFGAPRRMRTWGPTTSRHLRQERPLHLRPEMVHPALREKGRAIPQSHVVPKVVEQDPGVRPPPIPGMRPPMGGAGHVVPAPKVGGTMSIVMPLYTIGIVVFFMYTIMKVFVKKTGGDDGFKNFQPDPEFRRVVFADDYSNGCPASANGDGIRNRGKKEPSPPTISKKGDSTRLGDIEIDHLRKRLEETERAMERIVAQMGTVPAKLVTKAPLDTGKSLSSGPTKSEKKNLEEFCTEVKPSAKKELNTSEQAVIDEAGQLADEAEPPEPHQEDVLENRFKHMNEKPEEDVTTNYTTATMSGDAEAGFTAEAEDTAADVSNIEALDAAEDQEDLQDDAQIWNGDDEAEEQVDEEEEEEEDQDPPLQNNNYQHQR